MKFNSLYTLFTLFSILFSGHHVFAQVIPHDLYNDQFYEGHMIDIDGAKKKGWMRFSLSQKSRLKYKPVVKFTVRMYRPSEIQGFVIANDGGDSLIFESLTAIQVTGPLGMPTNLTHSFGQQISTGEIDLYHVHFVEQSGLSGKEKDYMNLVLIRNQHKYSMPFLQKIRKKQAEKLKLGLLEFLEDFPDVKADVEALDKEGGFVEVIDIVKKINSQ